ncbi:MAG: LemA family protein [Cyanobacteria bacterium J06592_8]
MGILIASVMIILVVVVIIINVYNHLVTLRKRYQNAYAQIDIQLRRRHDLIPNLVETVKGYMAHERETLEAVIQARNAAVSATSQAASAPGDPQAMQQLGQAEAALTGVLGRLFAVSESYPDLKADQSMGQLMEELRSTENRIAFARQAFNDSVTLYNTKREIFPSNLVAISFNFREAKLLEESSPEVKEVPRISF